MKSRVLGLGLLFVASAVVFSQPPATPAYKAAANAEEALARIEELGGRVRRVSLKDESLEVDLQATPTTDEHLGYLSKLDKVSVLRLRETKITDAGLTHVAKLAGLRRLFLEKTAVTDAGLKHLAMLKDLEAINLLGDAITDAGLETLKTLPKLKAIYVFDTKVTEAGVTKLKQAASGIQIVPDPAEDRQHVEIIWKSAKSVLTKAESDLAAAEKDALELMPKAVQLKKEADDATKQANELKKKSDEAKKKADESAKQARDLATQLADLAKEAAKKPDDVELKNTLADKLAAADRAKDASLAVKKTAEELQIAFQKLNAEADTLRKLSSRANNAKRNVEELKKTLEAARQQEAEARKLKEK